MSRGGQAARPDDAALHVEPDHPESRSIAPHRKGVDPSDCHLNAPSVWIEQFDVQHLLKCDIGVQGKLDSEATF